jgi:mRNA interferase RelE/StbE
MSGSKSYTIEYLEIVVQEDIPTLPKSAQSIIKKAIEERLMTDPIGFGKPLRYTLKGHRRLRVSDYRIVYRIESLTHKVIVIAIKHRKDIYEDF